MLYKNIEFYNLTELLQGDGSVVIPPECRPKLDERNMSDAEYVNAGPDGLWFCRIPNELRLKLNALALINAVQATGAEMRFNQLSETARITLKCNSKPAIAEVYHGSFHAGWHVIGTEPTELVITPPANLENLIRLTEENNLQYDARLTRVFLPWRPPARLISVEGDFAPPRPDQVKGKRFLAYGSSITHGNASVPPTGMYIHRTAQLLDADLINLGFGGGAHLEPEMADYIAARTDWDFATLETGINIGNIGAAEFSRRLDYFVDTIANAHPDKWIFCLGVFTCAADLNGNPVFAEYRDIVRAKVQSTRLPRLIYIDGRAILSSIRGLTTDLVHPSPYGMEEMARNLSTEMRKVMGK